MKQKINNLIETINEERQGLRDYILRLEQLDQRWGRLVNTLEAMKINNEEENDGRTTVNDTTGDLTEDQ